MMKSLLRRLIFPLILIISLGFMLLLYFFRRNLSKPATQNRFLSLFVLFTIALFIIYKRLQ